MKQSATSVDFTRLSHGGTGQRCSSSVREREGDASACMKRYQAFTLTPVMTCAQAHGDRSVLARGDRAAPGPDRTANHSNRVPRYDRISISDIDTEIGC